MARAVRVREERAAWALIAFGLAAWSAADLYYELVLSKLEEPPYPSIADAGWLVFYPACWVAVVLLMRRRIREFHASLWLDGIVAALGVAAVTAALVLPPILAMSVEGDPAAVAVNLAYPVGDVLLLVLLVGALALTGWRPDRPLALVGVGLLLSGAADIIYLSAIADGQADVPAWACWLWPASALATAIGAWQPLDRARAVRLEGRPAAGAAARRDGGGARAAADRPLRARERRRGRARLRDAGRRGCAALAHARRAHDDARDEPRRGEHRRADRPGEPARAWPRTSRTSCGT